MSFETHQPARFFTKRPAASKRGYGRLWQRIRLMHLREEPLCRACNGAATEVDHIDGDVTNNAVGNHQSLCKSCHAKKTHREQGSLHAK